MSTGYTVSIEERADLTFREFALHCAREMGVCNMQREDPIGDPVQEPIAYYVRQNRIAEARLKELRGLSDEGVRALWRAECERIEKINADSVAKTDKIKRRYARMREMVVAWRPPTDDHVGLRRFMLEQIDTSTSDWTAYTLDIPNTPGLWLIQEIKSAEWDLKYSAERVAEEVQKADEYKSWIDALYASL